MRDGRNANDCSGPQNTRRTRHFTEYLNESMESLDESSDVASLGSFEEYPEGSTEAFCKSTFRGNIEKSANSAREQAMNNLQKHLAKIMNDANCSDTVFICRNGVLVHASSALCMGRSRVLDSKFRRGIASSISAIINVNVSHIHSRVMLAVVEFLYTGCIARYRPQDWRMGLEIIKGAEFFKLLDIIGIVEEILSTFVETAAENLQEAGSMFSTAVELRCIRLKSVRRVAHLLRWEWMGGDNASNLSEEALRLILIRTETVTLDAKKSFVAESRFSEYFRFRGVLKWAIRSNNLATADDAEILFDKIIPVAEEKLYRMERSDSGAMILRWLPDYDVTSRTNGILHILLSHQHCKRAAARLLSNIDWMMIPPELLLNIVEPLRLVSEDQVINSLRRYYAKRPVTPVTLRLRWSHGTSLSVLNNGFLLSNGLSNDHNRRTLAVCMLQNRPSTKFAVWRFKVERLAGDLQVGFACWTQLADITSWDFGTSTLENIQS